MLESIADRCDKKAAIFGLTLPFDIKRPTSYSMFKLNSVFLKKRTNFSKTSAKNICLMSFWNPTAKNKRRNDFFPRSKSFHYFSKSCRLLNKQNPFFSAM